MAVKVGSIAPRSLTMGEYERDWEPAGWKLIIIGPTSTWRTDWGAWEAIRDIVQNCLDESEAYRWGKDDKGLWIIDKGKGVGVADFLLGPPKLKPDYARGKFGEGMKIAALALLRMGYPVHIKTVNRELWTIFLEQKVNGRVQTLAALWKTDGFRVGTEFHFIGYFGSAFEGRFAVNLPKSAIVAEVPSPVTRPIQRYNQLIKYDFPDEVEEEGEWAEPYKALREHHSPGYPHSRIFARDIYMQDILSPFSYNLWGFDMAPDRHAPKDENDMYRDMGRLWCGVRNMMLIESFLQIVSEPPQIDTTEGRRISLSSLGTEPVSGEPYLELIVDNKATWQSAWDVVIGKDAVIRTNARWDGMVKHLGYTSHSLTYGVSSPLGTILRTDSKLIEQSQEALRKVQVIPDTQLTAAADGHLKLARAIAARFAPNQYGNVVPVHAAIIPPASDRVRTAGLYDMNTGEIMLHLETLEKVRSTIDAMVHELGHHVAYERTDDPMKAEDLQPSHSEAMTYVAARVWELAVDRDFDQYLKGVVW